MLLCLLIVFAKYDEINSNPCRLHSKIIDLIWVAGRPDKYSALRVWLNTRAEFVYAFPGTLVFKRAAWLTFVYAT